MINSTVANYCDFLIIVMDVVCELGWRGDALQKLIQLNTTIVGGGKSEVNPGMHHIRYVVRIQVRNGSSLRSTRSRFDTFENVCPCGGGLYWRSIGQKYLSASTNSSTLGNRWTSNLHQISSFGGGQLVILVLDVIRKSTSN